MSELSITSVESIGSDEPSSGRPHSRLGRFGADRRIFASALGSPGVALAAAYLAVLVVAAVFPSLLAPGDPFEQNLTNSLAGPFEGQGLLGTDELGRDVLTRLVHGADVAVLAPLQAIGLALAIGIPIGIVAGYSDGIFGSLLLRVNDIFMSFPPLLLALSVIAILGPGLTNAMSAIGLIFAPTFVRIVRGVTLSVRKQAFFEVSASIGTPWFMVVRLHLLRAIARPVIVQASLAVGFAMLAEASLSFLGLGVAPPRPSWGVMMGRGVNLMNRQVWLAIFPGIAITLSVLSVNVVANALRRHFGTEAL